MIANRQRVIVPARHGNGRSDALPGPWPSLCKDAGQGSGAMFRLSDLAGGGMLSDSPPRCRQDTCLSTGSVNNFSILWISQTAGEVR